MVMWEDDQGRGDAKDIGDNQVRIDDSRSLASNENYFSSENTSMGKTQDVQILVGLHRKVEVNNESRQDLSFALSPDHLNEDGKSYSDSSFVCKSSVDEPPHDYKQIDHQSKAFVPSENQNEVQKKIKEIKKKQVEENKEELANSELIRGQAWVKRPHLDDSCSSPVQTLKKNESSIGIKVVENLPEEKTVGVEEIIKRNEWSDEPNADERNTFSKENLFRLLRRSISNVNPFSRKSGNRSFLWDFWYGDCSRESNELHPFLFIPRMIEEGVISRKPSTSLISYFPAVFRPHSTLKEGLRVKRLCKGRKLSKNVLSLFGKQNARQYGENRCFADGIGNYDDVEHQTPNRKQMTSLPKGRYGRYMRKSFAMKRKHKRMVTKKINSSRSCKGESHTNQDRATLSLRDFIHEDPEVLLMQPPANSVQDEDARICSFWRRSDLQSSARSLARSGFYLNSNDHLQCFSCSNHWSISQVLHGDPANPIWHSTACQRHFHPRRVNPSTLGLREVSSDTPGRVSDDVGDPPGQRSVYIPSGDVRMESYRLSTYEHFPVTCPISRKSLSRAGFYFTGFFDRVKCFACGRTVERWEAKDDPGELRWHKADCPFPKGEPCGNVPISDLFNRLHSTQAQRQSSSQEEVLEQRDPTTGAVIRTVRYPSDLPERIRRTGGTFEIGPGNSLIIQSGPGQGSNPPIHIGNERTAPPVRRWRMANVVSANHRRFLSNLYLHRELDRLTSFARWPVTRPNVSPATLARSGFFYLGDLDRTQCFSCGGVLRNWTLEDDAHEEHRTHFSTCPMVQGREPRNVPIPEVAETEEERNRNYPCLFPSSAHMRSEATRLEAFDQRWPRGRIGATPAAIAEAGFFFLGERDRVKCWYCNGGLQNWEYEDIPWNEHAKWFPNCQFLLRSKGVEFVHRHLALNPHLARPIIARQEGALIDPPECRDEEQQNRSVDIPPGGAQVRQPSPPPTIIDPQEEMRKKKERIENIMKNSEMAKTVLAMGFAEGVVFRCLEERIDAGNEANPEDIYDSMVTLLDDVMKKDEEEKRQQMEQEEEQASNIGGASNVFESYNSAYSSNVSNLRSGNSFVSGPASGRYQVSGFGDDDEPMEANDIYGSIVETGAAAAASKEPDDDKSIQEMLNKIEEERMCKVCFSNPADMVFIPCSHMCCCMDCTKALRQCPVCRTKIEKAIKTYIK